MCIALHAHMIFKIYFLLPFLWYIIIECRSSLTQGSTEMHLPPSQASNYPFCQTQKDGGSYKMNV